MWNHLLPDMLEAHATFVPDRMCPKARSRSCSGRAIKSAIADIPVPVEERRAAATSSYNKYTRQLKLSERGDDRVEERGSRGAVRDPVAKRETEGSDSDRPIDDGRPPSRSTESGGPAGEIVGYDQDGQLGAVGGEPARRQVVEAEPVLEVPDGVLALGVAPMVGFESERLVAVGDEPVEVVQREQRPRESPRSGAAPMGAKEPRVGHQASSSKAVSSRSRLVKLSGPSGEKVRSKRRVALNTTFPAQKGTCLRFPRDESPRVIGGSGYTRDP